MSTVLRPVGPQPPRVYWVRRTVLLVILVVVVLLIAKACSGGGSTPSADPGPTTTPTTSTDTSSPPPQVVACGPSDLTLVLSTDSQTYTTSQAPTLTGVFSNTSANDCKLTEVPADQHWTVTSGADTIWTTKGCETSTDAKTVTLRAGATKKIKTIWDGHRYLGCTQGDVVDPGTYHLSATLDGIVGTPTTFHFTDTTPTG